MLNLFELSNKYEILDSKRTPKYTIEEKSNCCARNVLNSRPLKLSLQRSEDQTDEILRFDRPFRPIECYFGYPCLTQVKEIVIFFNCL